MSKKDKEQDGVLLKEILDQPISWIMGNKGRGTFNYLTEPCQKKLADQLLAKAREAVKGAEIPDGSYLWSELMVYKQGQKAMKQAILKALGGE